MLLSTSVPMESAIPPSVIRLSDTPSASSTANEPSTATGNVVIKTSGERTSFRK